MPRADLMALTTDDLVTLSNRGLVKRAGQEVEAGELTCQIDEDEEGGVTVRWSDDVTCRLPAGATLSQGRCTCPATTLCRHLLRSVLAYQRAQTTAGAPPAEGGPAGTPWDPGGMTDADLTRQIPKATLARSRRLYDEGHVVELARSRKPSAVIHTLSCTVRFLVPGDPRYTHCDCSETAPCSHVALSVWAFRRLPPGADGGLVSTHTVALAVPEPLLDATEGALREIAAIGVSGAAQSLTDRLRRLEGQNRAAGLVWPAEILLELAQQIEGYCGHDARFSPERVAELVGELCVRLDAIRRDTGAVPPLFVRGGASDRVTEVGSARLVGLGCGVHVRRGLVEIAAYLQDIDSGTVVAVSRDFRDPAPEAGEPPRAFRTLAQTPVIKGAGLSALGAGQILVKGGRRTPACRFLPGRAPASFQPQTFAWESLRAPVLVEDLAELRARLAGLPPASLRPRRVGQSLFVCPVAGAADAAFVPREQAVVATLKDHAGGRATLQHPFLSRGAAGVESLLAHLQAQPEGLCFVAGHVRLAASGPVLMPTALVFGQGATRSVVQPWVDSGRAEGKTRETTPVGGEDDQIAPHPWALFLEQLQEALGELLLLGLERADGQTSQAWRGLQERGAALGFVRIASQIGRMREHLQQKQHVVRWEADAAGGALLRLLVITDMVRQELTV